jgi:hypothetical protein
MQRMRRLKVTSQEAATMSLFRILVMIVGLCVAGCTSDPNAPINQSFPIRQMDQFFGSMDGRETTARTQVAAPDYTHVRGYAPAYPPY